MASVIEKRRRANFDIDNICELRPSRNNKIPDIGITAPAHAVSISSYTKEEYERFLKGFFLLAHKNAKPTTSMAFLNAVHRLSYIAFKVVPHYR